MPRRRLLDPVTLLAATVGVLRIRLPRAAQRRWNCTAKSSWRDQYAVPKMGPDASPKETPLG